MPLIPILTHVAICDICGATDTHGSSPRSPLAREALAEMGWLFLPGIRNPAGKDMDSFCPRCAPLIRRQVDEGTLVPQVPV